MATKKIYLLDTNVLVHDPKAIFNFAHVYVGIPAMVLEELDSFKKEGTDRGRNARESARILDALRERGNLGEGVKLDNDSILRVLFVKPTKHVFPFTRNLGDNEILSVAYDLKDEGYEVIFISKDINARVKADALGIRSEDYIKEHISIEEFYQGWISVPVPAIDLKSDNPAVLQDLAAELAPNEYVLLESQHNAYNYRVFRYLGGKKFKPVHPSQLKWPFQERNPQQLMAMDVLLDDTIQLVTLFGPAGTGKTFLALIAGLHKVLMEHVYEKMLIARPVVPLGRDIGYLPGDLQEKMYSWMLPIYDNMDLIVHSAASRAHLETIEHENRDHKDHDHHESANKRNRRTQQKQENIGLRPLDELVNRGKISLEAITYMRGRSVPYQYILIDEVQNLTQHEVKTLVSRVGEGSKMILAGDPYQIDSPYLDFSSNGLVIASQKFKGQRVFGSVYLPTSERSELAKLASDLL